MISSLGKQANNFAHNYLNIEEIYKSLTIIDDFLYLFVSLTPTPGQSGALPVLAWRIITLMVT